MKGDLIILVKHYEFESTLVFFQKCNILFIYELLGVNVSSLTMTLRLNFMGLRIS